VTVPARLILEPVIGLTAESGSAIGIEAVIPVSTDSGKPAEPR